MRTLALLAGVSALALAAPANATLQFSANVNGSILTVVDQGSGDTNLAVGAIGIADQTINGVTISGSNQVQQIGATSNLNTSSFQIVNSNLVAVTVTVAVSGTDYLGPVAAFSASGSGTWQNANGSTINLTFYADNANGQGADTPTDLPGTQLASMSDTAVGPADSFSQNFSGAFVDPNSYSMSLGTTGTLAAWNGVDPNAKPTLVGRNQTIVTTQEVPEPSSLVLMGSGLLGMAGVIGWRRRSDRKNDRSNFAAA